MVEKAFPRQKFDATRDFVVTRPFIFASQSLVAGAMFDKDRTTQRRLRQLYDQRYLRMLDKAPFVNGEKPKEEHVEMHVEEKPKLRRRLATTE